MTIFILVMFQTYLEGLQEASGEEPSQTNIFPEDFAYALKYAKDEVIKVVVVAVVIICRSRNSSSSHSSKYT